MRHEMRTYLRADGIEMPPGDFPVFGLFMSSGLSAT